MSLAIGIVGTVGLNGIGVEIRSHARLMLLPEVGTGENQIVTVGTEYYTATSYGKVHIPP